MAIQALLDTGLIGGVFSTTKKKRKKKKKPLTAKVNCVSEAWKELSIKERRKLREQTKNTKVQSKSSSSQEEAWDVMFGCLLIWVFFPFVFLINCYVHITFMYGFFLLSSMSLLSR
ncbi:hypothetical protein DM860_006120 [Cuscuta australis]|uniref:Uncharacterized protein n=1 Tax=Cuscuta australis TaxID=267555 RepID=A0A328DKH7_9ASTE|nr:hypothetical protein DM860_006120 [Cuscuta australis]